MAATWQAWKRVSGRPLTATLFNGIRLRVYPDCLTSSAAYYFRVPNSLSIKFMRKHIDGGLLLDVGANVGLVSMLLADKIHQAWLFEPNPAAAARACENIRLNALDFEVLQVALSDQNGTVDFEDRGGVNAANRTVVGFKTNAPVLKVVCTTFDDFLAGRDQGLLTPCVVKIDVEGHKIRYCGE